MGQRKYFSNIFVSLSTITESAGKGDEKEKLTTIKNKRK